MVSRTWCVVSVLSGVVSQVIPVSDRHAESYRAIVQSLVGKVTRLVGGNETDSKCAHHDHTKGPTDDFPDEDASIWYVKERIEGERTHWTETDAAYLKLRPVTTKYVCLGCGTTRELTSRARVGGESGIKLKSELSDAERDEWQGKTMAGGFYNGWPDDHSMNEGGD